MLVAGWVESSLGFGGGECLPGRAGCLYDKCHHGACCKPVLSLFLCSTVCMAGNGLRCDECGAAFTGRPIQLLQTLSVLCSTNRTWAMNLCGSGGGELDLTLDLDLEMEWLAYMASKPQGAGRVGSRRCLPAVVRSGGVGGAGPRTPKRVAPRARGHPPAPARFLQLQLRLLPTRPAP